METLTWILFESVPALGAVLFVVLFALLVYWRRTLRAMPLLIGLAVAAGLLITQELVVTQREHAQRILRQLENAVVAGNVDAIAPWLTSDFTAGDMDREVFLEFADQTLRNVDVVTARRMDLAFRASAADTFTITAAHFAELSATSYEGPASARWELVFVRTPVGWRIAQIEPESLNRQNVRGWDDLFR